MDFVDIIGFSAAACTTLANLPQTWKILRERSEHMISLNTYLILGVGTAIWVVYGFIKEDYPLIIANAISTIISITLIILKIVPQKKLEKIHQKMAPSASKKKTKK